MGDSAEQQTRRSRWRPLVVVSLAVVIVAELVVAFAIGDAWFRPTSGAAETEESAETADPCAGVSTDLTILAPRRLEAVLTRAAADACIDLAIEEPGAPTAVASTMQQEQAAAWVADSSEQALALGVPADAVAPSFLSPIVMSAPAELQPALAQADWRDVLLSAPADVRLDIAAEGVSETFFTKVAERALELSGGNYAAVGAALAAVSTAAARSDPAHALSIHELASLPAGALVVQDAPTATLDYPLVRAPQISADAAAGVDRLVDAVRSLTPTVLAELGLVPAGATEAVVGGVTLPLLPHGPAAVYTAVSAVLDPGLLSGSMTVLMDASGSMAHPIGGGPSGMDAIKESISVLGGTIPYGLYTEWRLFGAGVGADGSDERLLSSGIVADNRELIAGSASALTAFPVGTPLYQVIVDNYRRMKSSPSADGINLLVVVTDGRDEDAPGRIERAQALAELAQLSAQGPPLPILFMGFGDADIAAMQEVVGVTGGNAWKIDQPAQLSSAIVESVLAIGANEIASSWAGTPTP